MSMETLLKSIEEQGKREMEDIKNSCDSGIREIKKKYEEEAKALSNDILHKARTESVLIRERIMSRAKMEARDMIDERKHKLIEEVFDKAEERILDSSDAEKKKILEKLASEAKKEMVSAKVFVDRKYLRLLPEAEAADINDFGVILKSKNGKEMTVITLKEKMEQIKSTKRHEIARVLFA